MPNKFTCIRLRCIKIWHLKSSLFSLNSWRLNHKIEHTTFSSVVSSLIATELHWQRNSLTWSYTIFNNFLYRNLLPAGSPAFLSRKFYSALKPTEQRCSLLFCDPKWNEGCIPQDISTRMWRWAFSPSV